MDSPGPALHFVSADLPSLACELAHADRQSRGLSSAAVLDLSGEQWLASFAQPATDSIQLYGAVPFAMGLWQQLQPRLDDWLQLLQLQQLEPLLVPPLPGVDMLLRCLCLAEALETDRPLTVLLPAPGEALALLELARTGPALLESLLEPLLAWWDQTRQNLSRLELVLRLNLPSSDSLRLDPCWRLRLERLADQLAPQAPWEFSLALECSDPHAQLLRQRFSTIGLRGFIPSRVGLQGGGAQVLLSERPSWWLKELPITALPPSPQPSELDEFLRQAPCTARAHLAPEGDRLLVPMPGVDKALLDVQQIGMDIVLICRGQRLLIPLPASLQGYRCSAARLEHGWLELRFS